MYFEIDSGVKLLRAIFGIYERSDHKTGKMYLKKWNWENFEKK